MNRVLIDGNSLGFAAQQGTALRAGDQPTQAVYGCVQAIRALRVRHPECSLIWLWDGASWRKNVSVVYKANREDDKRKREERRAYKSQAPFIRRALEDLGIPQLIAGNLEADDLAAILTRKYLQAGDRVHLITGDRDWLQLLDEGVTWLDHRDETRRFSKASIEKATGYKTVEQFVQAKALTGDTSDNLPGVGAVGDARAKLLLDTWGRVEAFLADPDPVRTWEAKNENKIPKALTDFHTDGEKHKRFAENFALMNLRGDLPAPESMRLTKGSFNPEGFKSTCHELGFGSIYRPEAFDKWIEPFAPKVH